MTKEEIEEGNKLIAEFRNEDIGHGNMVIRNSVWTTMKYHLLWDHWLMPVIRECKDAPTKYMYDWNSINAYMAAGMIDKTFEEVVKFVKWYNRWYLGK